MDLVAGFDPGEQPTRLERYANCPQTVTFTDAPNDRGNRRMKVKMLVRVDVVKCEPGGSKSIKLCRDFGLQLTADVRQEEHANRRLGHIGSEHAVRVDQIGDGRRRKSGPAFDEHDVKSNTQTRQGFGTRYRIA